MKPFWDRIDGERRAQQLTWTELARRVGVTRQALHADRARWREGRKPEWDTIVGLYVALKIPLWDLLLLAGMPLQAPPPDELAERAAALAKRDPRFSRVIKSWGDLDPSYQGVILAAIEAAERARHRLDGEDDAPP